MKKSARDKGFSLINRFSIAHLNQSKRYRTPTIDEFVPGFQFQLYHRTGMGFMIGGQMGDIKYNEYWTDEMISYPSLTGFPLTIYDEDGRIWVFPTKNPLSDESNMKLIEAQLDAGHIRVKIC